MSVASLGNSAEILKYVFAYHACGCGCVAAYECGFGEGVGMGIYCMAG